MRARIDDAMGPRWARLLLPLLATVTVLVDAARVQFDPSNLGALSFVAVALLALAGLAFGRRTPRSCELEFGAGFVRVRRAGLLTQTIHARQVTGASTSHSTHGVSIALSLDRGRQNEHPVLLLEVASEQEANAVRGALGIGAFGLGSLTFRAARRAQDRVFAGLRVLLAIAALTIAAIRVTDPDEPFLPFLLPLVGLVSVTALALRDPRANRLEGKIRLDRRGLHFGRGAFVETVRFDEIRRVQVLESAIAIARRAGRPIVLPIDPPSHDHVGMTKAEIDHLAAQIEAAAQRARGRGSPLPILPDAAALARRNADGRTWISRLDALAHSLARGPGYRGGALSESELWVVLESPDAPAEVRAAAARVLTNASEDDSVRARVATVIARMRERDVEERVRVMIEPDPETVVRQLEELEGEDDEHECDGYVRDRETTRSPRLRLGSVVRARRV